MANSEHLSMLREGVEAWNAWRTENPEIKPNLRRASLIGASLNEAHLNQANLNQANLDEANLEGASLEGASLKWANLYRTNLYGANLYGANLKWANLNRANLNGADLNGADLDFACLPLSCCGLNWKIDRKLAAQLAYHFCSMDVDDPEVKAAQNALLPLANEMHRMDVPRLKTKQEGGEE